ncbi:MAG: N-acetylmuramoyl-L-alanine amidase [Coriobacteriia bacterium]|nr:N-acetylmuramoyl-L-alanine amidase [Coriobacteriia bacterium]
MARRYSVNAGHSAASPGTRGHGLHEHIEARWATNRMIQRLNAMGNWAGNSTSDAATASAVLTQQRDRARAHNPHIVISNHLNGFSNAAARGVEVLYRNAAMLPLARAVSAAIARELGIPNRGPRRRTDLFFLNSFPSNGILIEWAFMTNAADMAAWTAHRNRAVDAVAQTIAVNTGGRVSAPAATNPAATAPAGAPAVDRVGNLPLPSLAGVFGIQAVTGKRFRLAANLTVWRQPNNTSGSTGAVLPRDTVITPLRRATNGQAINGNRNWWWTGMGWVPGTYLAGNVEQFRTTSRTHFRGAPNGTILRTLNADVTVTAISSSETIQTVAGHRWRNVSVGGQRGWIATSLLRAI